MSVMFAVLLALSAQGTDDAEQLFQRMEDTFAKAKTLACVVDLKAETTEAGSASVKLHLVGSLLLAEGNRSRLELKERTNDEAIWRLLVSDGSRSVVTDKGSDPQVHDVPKNQNAEMLTAFTRTGVFLPQTPLPPAEVADFKDRFRVSEFRLGKKEKIGGREMQRFEYQLDIKGQSDPISVEVWLDQKTGLPARRAITSRAAGSVFTLTEDYGKLALDEKIDVKLFELPK